MPAQDSRQVSRQLLLGFNLCSIGNQTARGDREASAVVVAVLCVLLCDGIPGGGDSRHSGKTRRGRNLSLLCPPCWSLASPQPSVPTHQTVLLVCGVKRAASDCFAACRQKARMPDESVCSTVTIETLNDALSAVRRL